MSDDGEFSDEDELIAFLDGGGMVSLWEEKASSSIMGESMSTMFAATVAASMAATRSGVTIRPVVVSEVGLKGN
jgi:hypothetical protein